MTVKFIIERRDGGPHLITQLHLFECTINQYNPIAILVMAKNMAEKKSIIIAI